MQTLAQEGITILGQAIGGGLLLAFFAWTVCRIFTRLTASLRFWLWWLVGAKFIIGLVLAMFGVSALRVPVLKAEHFARLRGLARKTVAQARQVAPVVALTPPAKTVTFVEKSAPSLATVIPQQMPVRFPQKGANPSLATETIVPLFFVPIMGVYFFGVVLLLSRSWIAARAMQAILRDRELCDHPVLLDEAQSVALSLGVRPVPHVFLSTKASAPFIVGGMRPEIVLPVAFLTEPTATRRLILAHEMAHARRGDLPLEVVPFLVRVLFWFLPTAHFVANEIVSSREEACDLLAVQASATSPSLYATVLISVSTGARSPLPTMAMAAPSSKGFQQIKRRLRTLMREANQTPLSFGWRCVALGLVGVQGAATLLPLRPALARAAEVARAALPAPHVPQYLLTDLGTLGGNQSGAFGINDRGQVVGTAHVFPLGSRGHAFLWQDGHLRDLTAGSIYRHSQAVAVSNTGYVAGFAYRSSYRSGQQTAFLWNGSRRLYLPPAEGFRFARATSVNDSGSVVGASLSGGIDAQGATIAQATVWENNTVQNLGTLGGAHSIALDMNGSGTVVGKADLPISPEGKLRTHPFVWNGQDGVLKDLGTLGGDSGVANAVNTRGWIVGSSQTKQGTVHAFVITNANEAPRDLGTTPYADSSTAFAINENGNIVGKVAGPTGEEEAVLWLTPNSKPVDLNQYLVRNEGTASWHLETARGINANGQIIGQGTVAGKRHAFLLTPQEK